MDYLQTLITQVFWVAVYCFFIFWAVKMLFFCVLLGIGLLCLAGEKIWMTLVRWGSS